MAALELSIDTPVNRVTGEYMSSLVSGVIQDVYGRDVPGWVGLSDLYVEPIAKTLMLAPMVTRPDWQTSIAGINARMRLTDWTLSESAKWKEDQTKIVGDYYFIGENLGANSSGITTASYEKNRGWLVSFFAHDALDQEHVVLEVGWGATVGATTSVSLKFWTSGKVDIYKLGVLVDTGTISGSRGAQSVGNTQTQVLLIPARFRELLIIGLNQGDGHKAVFEDIDDSDSSPSIVDAGKFWFRVPYGGTSRVQLAPLKFPSSGYCYGAKTIWKRTPATGEVVSTEHLLDVPYYGTQSVASSFVDTTGAAWVSDGVKKEGFIKIAFTGDGISTNFVYFGRAWVLPKLDSTPDETTSLIDYHRALTMTFEESLDSTMFTAEIVNPDGCETTLGIPALQEQTNRPFNLSEFGDLACYPPEADEEANSEAEVMNLKVVPEIIRKLMMTRFDDIVPFDGREIEDAFNLVCEACGLASGEYNCSVSGYTIAFGGSPSEGEFGPQITSGMTGIEVIQELHADLCATWFLGITLDGSDMKIEMLSPADKEATPAISMFLCQEDADDPSVLDILEPDPLPYNTFYSWHKGFLEPEANDIWVTGFDPRTKRPILLHKPDLPSQDPTTAAASRPSNWLGGIQKYGLEQKNFTSEAICTRACELLFDRLTPRKVMRTARCRAMKDSGGVFLTRGRLIRVWEPATTGEWVNYRIVSAKIKSFSEHSAFQEPGDTEVGHREGEYVLEREDSPGDAGGKLGILHGNMTLISQAHRAGLVARPAIVRKGSEGISKVTPARVVHI